MSIEDPLDGGSFSVLRHWGFVWDYNDDEIGGFASGEFLLRSDGALLKRMGYSIGAGDDMRWKFMGWDAEAGTEVATVSAKLIAAGYGLYKPSPVPINESTGGPYPGFPDLAEEARDLTLSLGLSPLPVAIVDVKERVVTAGSSPVAEYPVRLCEPARRSAILELDVGGCLARA